MSDATETPRPLDGIVVIDIGQLIAAPLVGQMLGDLGATVIKVENRGKGDLSRFIVEPIYRNPDGDPIGESVLSFAMNRNKRSIEVDISTEDGQGIIRALADKADVLIQNLRVGTMERFGLGWDNLKESNPALIMCSISGYGQTGPYARRSAKDSSLQAMSGLMSLTGQAEGEPQKVGYPVADVNAGLYATIAILAALRGRDTQGGRGQHIDISLLDCQIAALGHRILSYFVSGRVPLRNGNVPPGTSMARTIQCRDAWITISADADNEFPVFCRVLGRPELAADPRFSDQAGRSRNIDALLAEIEPIMRSRDAAAWIDDLSEARIICSPIYTIDQMLGDPQVVERGLAQTVDHPVLGETPIIGNPIRMSETRLDHHTAPPLLGSSTDDVLRDFLGLSPDRIDALRAAKVI